MKKSELRQIIKEEVELFSTPKGISFSDVIELVIQELAKLHRVDSNIKEHFSEFEDVEDIKDLLYVLDDHGFDWEDGISFVFDSIVEK